MKWPISVSVDVEFHQQIEVAGGGIDFRGDLGLGERIGDRIGLAELAFELHEKGNHARLRDHGRKLIPNRTGTTQVQGRTV